MSNTEIPPDRKSKPRDSLPSIPESCPSLPGRDSLEILPSHRFRTPFFIRGGILMAILGTTAIGMSYLLNWTYNQDSEVRLLADGSKEYRQIDGMYAHTIFTTGDPHYGKDSVVVQQNFWNRSRTYVSYQNCSSVDEIIVQEGKLGSGEELRYQRSKDAELKDQMFANAEAELQQQCARFKPLMDAHRPKRLSR